MFDEFETTTLETPGAAIRTVIGGHGPPGLLLHGTPQTHVMWHKVAPGQTETELARFLAG